MATFGENRKKKKRLKKTKSGDFVDKSTGLTENPPINQNNSDDKKKKKRKKKNKNQQDLNLPQGARVLGENVVDEKGFTLGTVSDFQKTGGGNEPNEAAKKLEAYNKRQQDKKESQRVTSVTKVTKETPYSESSTQETTYSKGGKEISEEEAKPKPEPEKTTTTESTTSTEENTPPPPGITPKENKKRIKNEKKKQRIENSEKSEAAEQAKKDELRRQKEQDKKQKAINKSAKLTGKIVSKIKEGKEVIAKSVQGEPITDKEIKGSHVSKILQYRAARQAKKAGVDEQTMKNTRESIDFYNKTVDALQGEDKESIFKKALAAGGASPQDIATVEYLKPTDYYPQIGRNIGVGTSTGEIIGSRTIYTGAGVVAPMGLYDARRRALKAAAKSGILKADGKIPDLSKIDERYRLAYEKYGKKVLKDVIDNHMNNDGTYTKEGQEKINKLISLGEEINGSLKTTDGYFARLTGAEGGKQSGELYMKAEDRKYLGEFARIPDEFSEDIDFDELSERKFLERVRGIKLYDDLQADAEESFGSLEKDIMMDRENYMKNSKYYDEDSKTFTKAYKTKIVEPRITKMLDGMMSSGRYSQEQYQGVYDYLVGKFTDIDRTVVDVDKKAVASSGSTARLQMMNNSFSGKTRVFYNAVSNQLNAATSMTDAQISTIYATNVGGRNTNADGELIVTSMFGYNAPVVVEDMAVEGAPLQVGSMSGPSQKFAVEIDGVYTPSLASEVKAAMNAGKDVRSLSTGELMPKPGAAGYDRATGWLDAWAQISTFAGGDTYAMAQQEINLMGYTDESTGTVIPLNGSNFDDFKASKSQVQLKSFMYKPVVRVIGKVEYEDASRNKAVKLLEEESSPGLSLIGTPNIVAKDGTQNERFAAMHSESDADDKYLRKP